VSTTARRIVFPEVRWTAWEEVPVPSPDQLRPNDLLIRTSRTLVSAGTEIAIYSGSHIGYTIPGATYPRLPHHPGYSLAGTVLATGSAVTAYRTGDRVAASAPHASTVVVDAAGLVAPLPDGVSFEQGCLARLATIAMQGVRLARVSLGETAAVFGQGLVGQFARQHVYLEGAALALAVDLIGPRLDLARRHGAAQADVVPIDARTQDPLAAIMERTGGRGVDVAIEATGSPQVIDTALKAAADFGRVVLLGSPRGRVEIDPYSDVHRKGVSLIGAHARTADLPGSPHPRFTMRSQLRTCLDLMRQGRLLTDGLVSHHVRAADALPIFDALTDHPDRHLGVIIDWS
jgi:threonine dehydrogenase-like Zn-dependent dehydrogenase